MSIKVSFRKFRPSDAIKTSNLIGKTLFTTNSREYPKKSILKFARSFSSANLEQSTKTADIYVVVQGNSIIGCGKLMKGGWIGMLFVSPKSHRKGIGTKILRCIEETAKRHKVRLLRANAAPGAVPFYKKFGFRKVKTKKVGTGGIAYLMVKRLKKD